MFIRYQWKQVSPGFLYVNLSSIDLLEEDRNEKEFGQLVHIGTCGLHTSHNSMKHGEKASGWNVKKLLTSLHRIFDEPPSRRADYEALNKQYLQTTHYSSVQIVGMKTKG